MKKALSIKIMVEEKDVRRIVALVLGDSISDEELHEKFFSEKLIEFDATEVAGSETDGLSVNAMFIAHMISKQ